MSSDFSAASGTINNVEQTALCVAGSTVGRASKRCVLYSEPIVYRAVGPSFVEYATCKIPHNKTCPRCRSILFRRSTVTRFERQSISCAHYPQSKAIDEIKPDCERTLGRLIISRKSQVFSSRSLAPDALYWTLLSSPPKSLIALMIL